MGMQGKSAGDGSQDTAGAMLDQAMSGQVLVLLMANRPVNALSAQLRAALVQAFTAAAQNPAVLAVVIASDLAQFSAGADLAEMGGPKAQTNLSVLCNMVENFPKPVVVAINGHAVGGGLELALAAHGRVADARAQLALPEVHLGILPSAGGTQRLPRLVGAGPALQIMLENKPLTAGQGLAIGLLDAVVTDGLREKAVAMAQAMADKLQGRAPLRTADRRDGLRDGAGYQTALAARRKQLTRAHLPAAGRVIDCVEAAQLLAIDQGLAYEAAAFDDLVTTPAAQALRHAFMAERRAMFPPADLASHAPPALTTVAVWGGGDRAGDVIVQALGAGLRVMLVDPRREVLVATLERIAHRQTGAVAAGRMSAQARDADWARLDQSLDAAALIGTGLILRAPDAPALAADADGAPLVALGPLLARAPLDSVALVPAPAQGLAAELCAGPDAPVGLRAAVLAFGRRLGWKMMFSGPGGPIERRLRATLSAAIGALEAAGVEKSALAASLASFGMGLSDAQALPPAPPQANEVIAACLAALANQGAQLISQGVARRPADVDAMAMLCGIIPRWQGGPMFWADQRGLLVVRADLNARSRTVPALYTPDPLFDQMISQGSDFAALNRI